MDPPRPGGGGDSPARWDNDGDRVEGLAGLHIFDQEADKSSAKNGMANDHDASCTPVPNRCITDTTETSVEAEQGKCFYDEPLHEHTGIWVPVSVPPMTAQDREDWHKGFGCNGGYFPEEEFSWELGEENKEMTMWDVFADMVVAAKSKMVSAATYDFGRHGMSVVSNFFLQEAWKDMAQTLADANAGVANELLETEPTKWLPDSAANACMLCGVGRLKPEKAIPDAILRQAKGLAIVTVVKVGMMVTYKLGTGLVVARRADGSWSPPSAISTCGVGYGAQAGGEIADFIIVLRNTDAIRTFSGKAHLSVGAGVSASAGHIGRVAEADFRAGDGGYAACYTYSCSKGAFVGCAFNGSIVSTRDTENARFYGGPVKASDILLGSMARPPAASPLYKALSELMDRVGK
nr:unnamed protein product [Digitaria exilis]